MAQVSGKGQATCLKRVAESTNVFRGNRKIQLTNVIVGARLATVSRHAVGFLSIRDIHDLDPLENKEVTGDVANTANVNELT